MIVSEELRLVFTGDITVNIAGFTEEQAKFNVLAPYLMTSVNMNSQLATAEREGFWRTGFRRRNICTAAVTERFWKM